MHFVPPCYDQEYRHFLTHFFFCTLQFFYRSVGIFFIQIMTTVEVKRTIKIVRYFLRVFIFEYQPARRCTKNRPSLCTE